MSANAIPICRNSASRKRVTYRVSNEFNSKNSLCVALLACACWLGLMPPFTPMSLPDETALVSQPPAAAAEDAIASLSAAEAAHALRESRHKEYIAERFKLAREEVELIVETVYKSASQFEVSPNLIFAVIAVESSFNADASNAGAIGLMQVMPSYHRKVIHEFGGNGFDPVVNIYAGTKVLKQYIAMSKTTRGALLRYNGSLSDPEFTYARKVFREMQHFEKV